jgi:hypothetical protein
MKAHPEQLIVGAPNERAMWSAVPLENEALHAGAEVAAAVRSGPGSTNASRSAGDSLAELAVQSLEGTSHVIGRESLEDQAAPVFAEPAPELRIG